MLHLICYDICCPKRLKKTSKLLESYGLRLQKSFFQTDIDIKSLEFLKKKIINILDLEKDYFFIYPLCAKCSRKGIVDGKGEILKLEDFEIL